MQYNLVLDTDSYKASHYLQYPPGTTSLFAYIESRGGRYPNTVFFGLQYLLKEYLSRPVEQWMVEEAKDFFAAHGLPFNYEGWSYIVRERGGKLPVRIRAVSEGSVVPVHNALVTIESTDPAVFWLVTYLETLLLRVWYPITVATRSWYLKQTIREYLDKSADEPESEIAFKLHDFGSRGVSSSESAGIGGMAHLVNFQGSDTAIGVRYANHYYHQPMAAFSIPAAEHSTIIAWGREREVDAYRNMLGRFARPGATLAVVSDSYDLWNAVRNLWGGDLRSQIEQSGATVVIRPDSGIPAIVVSRVLNILDNQFGSTINSKGYKLLNHVRVIQGDGVDHDTLAEVLETALKLGFSASNIAFGMGGQLLQVLNRDTLKFAMKVSEVEVDGRSLPVFKDPITDPGKRSKQGRLDLVRDANGEYTTVRLTGSEPLPTSELVTVFEDGEVCREYTLNDVRSRAGA
ncbi:nicotinate phosphoribosyltransferase [Gloeobacter kilaueensis]|uniref:Nicotinamide phosphoribosyltransferase n=1 Tax=Gloeobacter kilaueensis (strain ATCC BAA-2537 / CCAP 1431/1 / ULC 316 / JS1) TaxID=1183438 RepID=U5QKT7_GLOK1|nr:nicotinate phosphoribosyltransferase [Gloeobacter kilaueensis]AGY59478.1 nicotinate phosphoribosyltransferase [Gloeobacter kilaueensis JS1]